MNDILLAMTTLGGLGVAFGAGLAVASKKFCVVTDPRLEKIIAHLPGANCGTCGMPGCIGFAEGLIQGTCTVEKCAISNEDARRQISGILGLEAKVKIKTLAVLHCHGGRVRAKDKYVYSGIRDCVAASLQMGGPKTCVYGCIGFGTCARACPFGAITMNDEDLPVVNESRCTACGKCVAACPKRLFTLVAATKAYNVRCMSRDFGKAVMEACSVGCIACRKCERACPTKAMKVIDNLAVIDYHICDNRGECFKVCPTNAIAKKERTGWVSKNA